MPPFSLPAPSPVSVSAEVRLAYVLRHFRLAYPGAPLLSIGYAGAQPQVEIAELGDIFFSSNAPYPIPPRWRYWQGQQVPFFFDQPENQLLVLQENKVIITADIISAAFYLLSGWQEYFSTARDQHGRFPYAASVQQQYGFVALPVVNYYFDVLRAAVEHVSGHVLQPRRWGPQQAKFAAFLSHDVDNLYSGWKEPAKVALQQCKLGRFGKLLWQHLTQPDAWDNLEAVAVAVAQYGAKSTFFILPSSRPAPNGISNADYKLTNRLRQRLQQLATTGSELAIHGPIGTATDAHALAVCQVLNFVKAPLSIGNGLRFHYLSWEPRHTQTVVETAGFEFDSTLGFAEHFGFRHSYCQPFYPFNFERGEPADFLEIPLNVMDATLHHPNYLQLAPDQVLPALRPLFAEIKRFGGVASILWHNQNFDPANELNGPRQFHEIMTHLQAQGAAFRTGHEIWQEFTGKSPIPNF